MPKSVKLLISIITVALMSTIFLCFYSISKAVDEDGNIVIVIDPGHGGFDPGAVKNGFLEKDLNMDISLAFKKELETYAGVKVYLTHYGLPSNEELDIWKRGDIANYYNADRFFSVHNNAGGNKGAEVYVTRSTAKLEYKQESTKLGNMLLAKYSALGIANRGVRTRDSEEYTYADGQTADWYGVIRYPMNYGIPGMLLEHAYMDSTDIQFLNTPAKLEALGKADATAVAEYYGFKKRTLYMNIDTPTSDATVERTINVTGWGIGPKVNSINIYVDENLVKSNATRLEREDIHIAYPGFKVTTPNPGFEYALDTMTLSDGEHIIKIELVANDGEKSVRSRTIFVDNSGVVRDVKLDASNITMLEGKTYNLKAVIYPITAVNKKVSWESSDTEVLIVNNMGQVNAVKVGSAAITVTTEDGKKKTSCNVTVNLLEESQSYNLKNELKETDIFLSGIQPKITEQGTISINKQDILNDIELVGNLKVQICDANNNVLTEDSAIPNGSILKIMDNEDNVLVELIVVLYGDVDSNGKISISDIIKLQRGMLSKEELSPIALKSGILSSSKEKPSVSDLIKIQKSILYSEKLGIQI